MVYTDIWEMLTALASHRGRVGGAILSRDDPHLGEIGFETLGVAGDVGFVRWSIALHDLKRTRAGGLSFGTAEKRRVVLAYMKSRAGREALAVSLSVETKG